MARILCIDDHTLSLSAIMLALENEGHTVVSANGPEPALQAIAEDHIDLVLLDCHNSGNDGNLVAALRIVRPEIPVVMTSGFCALPCDRLKQADACIQKGDHAALARTIDAVLCAAKYGLCRSVAA